MAATEPRRSGRATKGQHTKKLDESAEAVHSLTKALARTAKPIKKKTAVETEAEQDEEEQGEVIRCVCGATEEDEDDERMMICCDKCGVWQHNECMEITEDEDRVPEEYWCEQCKPENHEALLAAMAKGEKPWEERRQAREQAEAEKKKGKKGAASRAKAKKVEVLPIQDVEMADTETNGDSTTIETKAQAESARPKRAAAGAKRKLRDDVDDKEYVEEEDEPMKKVRKTVSPDAEESPEPKQPQRKASTAKPIKPLPERKNSKNEPIQLEAVDTVEGLVNATRRAVALSLVKAFISYYAQSGLSKADAAKKGTALGLGLEHATYIELSSASADPTPEYRAKVRSTLFNLKQNDELRQRLLDGEVSPQELASMGSEEMQPEEMQKADEEMKKEAEKQVVLIADDGPRIRRTHKGEELVETGHDHTNESIFTTSVPRALSEEPAPVRRGSTSSVESEHIIEEVELPDDIGEHSPPLRSPSLNAPSKSPKSPSVPLKVDTKSPRDTHERRASNFNINDIWSSVKSADPEKQRTLSGVHAGSPTVPQGPIHDPDIDKLLKDEDIDSPPYSPTGHDEATGENIWRGTMSMHNIADFSARAHYFGGVDISSRIPWSHLLPAEISVDGRIDPNRANDYLCESHYASSTDVVVIQIDAPAGDPTAQDGFGRLFDYFNHRQRYGVIGKTHIAPVKDIYLIPVEQGMAPLPAILNVLPNLGDKLEAPRAERFLLLTFVIKGPTPGLGHLSRSTSTSISIPAAEVFTPGGYTPITPGPVTGQGTLPYQFSPTLQSPPTQFSPPQAHQSYPSAYHQSPPLGILSTSGTPTPPLPTQQQSSTQALLSSAPPYISQAPTLKLLLEQAPNIGIAEMRLVLGILEADPIARTDRSRLMALLVERQQQLHSR